MISGSCHCGAVHVEIPRRPQTVTNCNCSICRRYGTLWAYYRASDVRVVAPQGATQAYSWGDKRLRFVRCTHCGCVINWERIDPAIATRVGVNMRNFEPQDIGPVRIKLLDGASTWKYVDWPAP